MRVTALTLRALAVRREERRMQAAGYRRRETDYEVHRGLGQRHWLILDAVISVDRKHVWTRIGPPEQENA
jgi:hypothetical protein